MACCLVLPVEAMQLAICEVLSARRVTYPGSTLRLSFAVAPPPARPTK
jgi:hypothetical protein